MLLRKSKAHRMGSPGRQGGGVLLKFPRGGGLPEGWEGARGRAECLQGIWEGGGGINVFIRGPNAHQE